jgi:polyphosphate kinase
VRREALEFQLEDNCQLWELGPDGQWTRRQPEGALPHSAQQRLLEELGDGASAS